MNIINKIYNDSNFMKIAKPIIENKEFEKTKLIKHHDTTRFNHSVKVAYLSYRFSKVLGLDDKSIVRGATLHDFFLERDDENIKTETKMLIKHPKIAKENAIKYFGVNEKEQNIIESHMFPVSNVLPRTKEAWIVSFCDKLIAASEGTGRVKAQVSLWILFIANLLK